MADLKEYIEEVDRAVERLVAHTRTPLLRADGYVALLRDIAASGVELDEPRLGYVVVQIDRDVWRRLASFQGGEAA